MQLGDYAIMAIKVYFMGIYGFFSQYTTTLGEREVLKVVSA